MKGGRFALKDQIYTIPVTEGFEEGGECAFCSMRDKLNENGLEFIMGSSYMDDRIRMETNKIGFCKKHYEELFYMKNKLGLALIMYTHIKEINENLENMKDTSKAKVRSKRSLFGKEETKSKLTDYLDNLYDSCYVCNRVEDFFERYMDTFFYMWKRQDKIKELFKNSKGFCIHHYSELIKKGEQKLNSKEYEEFLELLIPIQIENFKRLEDELDWFIKKFDYRFTDEPWKNSKDSIDRGLTKLSGAKVEEE